MSVSKNNDLPSSLEELEQILSRIGGATQLLRDVRDMRALLLGRRPPRIAILGRRGAGKSSIGNCLLGARVLEVGAVQDTTRTSRWVDIEHNDHTIRWLDTPGLRPGNAVEKDRRESLRRQLASEVPDVILFAVRATEVESGLNEDLAELSWQLDRLKRAGLAQPSVIAIVTRVDELAPVRIKAPPFEGEKLESIERAVETVRTSADKAKVKLVEVLPTCCYQRFFQDGTLAVDWRWGIDKLADKIFQSVPAAAQMETARAFESNQDIRRRVSFRIVRACTSLSFFIGTTSIPIADAALLIPLQTAMLSGVVIASGKKLGPRTISEWATSIGINLAAGLAFREVARAAVKLIPGLGSPIAGAVAASGTWAVGTSAIRYFIDGATPADTRAAFERAKENGAPRDLMPLSETLSESSASTRPDAVSVATDHDSAKSS